MDHFKVEMKVHQNENISFDKLKNLQRKTDAFFQDKLFNLKENLNLTNQNSFLRQAKGLTFDPHDSKYPHQQQNLEGVFSGVQYAERARGSVQRRLCPQLYG